MMARDILTRAKLPGTSGFMDWGRLPRAEIIKRTREYAAQAKAEAEALLNAPDEAFDVCVIEGVHRQKLVERL